LLEIHDGPFLELGLAEQVIQLPECGSSRSRPVGATVRGIQESCIVSNDARHQGSTRSEHGIEQHRTLRRSTTWPLQ
jgi:hypothetical protein